MSDAVSPATKAHSADSNTAVEVAPRTWKFLATLPPSVKLVAVVRDYPHIANRCAELWQQPSRLDEYLRSVMEDRRGDRAGFPIGILTELTSLREHLATCRPDRYKIYDLALAPDGSLSGAWHSSERSAPGAVPVVRTGEARFANRAQMLTMTGAATAAKNDFHVEVYVDGERVQRA